MARRKGRGERPDDDPTPGPSERSWIHPSELPTGPAPEGRDDGAPGRQHRLSAPLTAGMAGALAAFGLTALVLGSGDGGGAPSSTTALARSASLGGLAGGPSGAAGGIDSLTAAAAPSVLGVSAWTGPQVRYGSAVAYHADGVAVTAASLVAGASSIELVTADGRAAPAEVVGADADYDLALLRTSLDLTPLDFTERPTIRTGDPCLLVGAGRAGGDGPWAAAGVVTGLGEVVPVHGGWMVDVLTVDVELDPAGAGGALLDARGALLGVLTDGGGRAAPATLAVPARTARRSAEQLLHDGAVEHPWLGLATTDATEPVRGALVRAVNAAGPASAAGVLPGDVVTHLEGREVQGMASLLRAVRRQEVGEAVALALVRGGERIEVLVTLAARPGPPR